MDAGSRLSCLSLIAQGAEQVETPSSFSQEKHWEAQNQLWLLCMSQLFYSHLFPFAQVSKTKLHLQEALQASRALTVSPKT